MSKELELIVEYRDSITEDIKQLEKFDRSCCDQAEFKTLQNVENALNIIIKKIQKK